MKINIFRTFSTENLKWEYPIGDSSSTLPSLFHINAVPCISWRYMRPANFVIKWSRSISRADAAGNGRTKWLASSHLYYRWIELIFKVRPIMGFPSSLTVAARKGKGHFHVSPPILLQSVCLYLLPPISFTFLFSCFRFISFYVIRTVRKRYPDQSSRSEKRCGVSVLMGLREFWQNWVSKNIPLMAQW